MARNVTHTLKYYSVLNSVELSTEIYRSDNFEFFFNIFSNCFPFNLIFLVGTFHLFIFDSNLEFSKTCFNTTCVSFVVVMLVKLGILAGTLRGGMHSSS